MRRFGEFEFADLVSGMSIDKKSGGNSLIYDASGRVRGWQPPEYYQQKEQQMQKNTHSSSLQHIKDLTDMVRRNEIGKSVASVRAKNFHDEHLYDPYRKNERSRVLSDHQQFAHAMAHHPVFRALGEAMAQGNESTQDELAKEYGLDNVDDVHTHERRKHPNDGEFGGATKRQTISSICNAEIDRMAKDLVKRAKAEKGVVLTVAKAWEIIINGTQKGAWLNNLEKWSRIGVS
jgi:hypothetical protein